MSTSSARPDELRRIADGLGDRGDALGVRRSELTESLNAFRASEGWQEYLGDVPPLDIDVGAVRGRVDQMAGFVNEVAFAFELADPTPTDDGGAITIGDDTFDPWVSTALGEVTELVRDGDRWVVPGTGESDFVRVVRRDGATVLEVGEVIVGDDGRRQLVWRSRNLTDDQAANLVIRTGGEDDWIAVAPEVRVGITVWTGDGGDVVGSPGENVYSRLGGSGDDLIFTGSGGDRITAGAGDDEIWGGADGDHVDGQDGDDVVHGGEGEDNLYGGRDADLVEGGEGEDYLEGGSGADDLRGGRDADIVSGGRDADSLDGGSGNDELFGGRGDDEVDGGAGADTATGEAGDDVADARTVTIELTGEPGSYAIDLGSRPDWMTDAEWDAWLERIDSDIEMLRTTVNGRAGLVALDAASRQSDHGGNPFDDDRHIRIYPYQPERGNPASFDEFVDAYLNDEKLPGEDDGDGTVDSLTRGGRDFFGGDQVSFTTTEASGADYGPTSLVLQHELSHAWDSLHDGWVDIPGRTYTERLVDAEGSVIREETAPRPELNSVGLDLDGDDDFDTVGAGDGTDHPVELTENALRRELGLPERDSYTMGTEADRAPGEHVEYGDTGD